MSKEYDRIKEAKRILVIRLDLLSDPSAKDFIAEHIMWAIQELIDATVDYLHE